MLAEDSVGFYSGKGLWDDEGWLYGYLMELNFFKLKRLLHVYR